MRETRPCRVRNTDRPRFSRGRFDSRARGDGTAGGAKAARGEVSVEADQRFSMPRMLKKKAAKIP